MALKWRRRGTHSWIGTGGKYSYHVKKLTNYYGIAYGDINFTNWFEYSLSFEQAKEIAERDVINDIIKSNNDDIILRI